MQADPEDLRRYYSSLPDEALLAIDRNDLVEIAQKCYDAETDRRKLAPLSTVPRTDRLRPVPRQSDDLSSGEAEAGVNPPDAEDRPAWLDQAAEVYSVVVRPGTAAGDAASDAMGVLKAAGIPCHLELIEMPEEYVPSKHRWRLMAPANLNLRAMNTLERDLSNQEFETVWKTYLEALSDSELLAVSPEIVLCGLFDRIERVTKTFEEEIARRRLKAESL
jgi:hypothetical protein